MNKLERFAEAIATVLEMSVKKGTLTKEQADRITGNIDKPEYMKPFLDLLGISDLNMVKRDYVVTLTTMPVNDSNYAYALTKYATIEEIEKAVEIMEQSPYGNKSRITACNRELRKRRKS